MRFFLFCVSHHLIDDITLIHVTHCVMNLFFLLTLLFLKDSLTISLSYLLELNLFAHNVVLCLPDTTLRCDCRRLISRNYWFEQVMLLLQVKFINTLKLLMCCWYLLLVFSSRLIWYSLFLFRSVCIELGYWSLNNSFNFRDSMTVIRSSNNLRISLYIYQFKFNLFFKSHEVW